MATIETKYRVNPIKHLYPNAANQPNINALVDTDKYTLQYSSDDGDWRYTDGKDSIVLGTDNLWSQSFSYVENSGVLIANGTYSTSDVISLNGEPLLDFDFSRWAVLINGDLAIYDGTGIANDSGSILYDSEMGLWTYSGSADTAVLIYGNAEYDFDGTLYVKGKVYGDSIAIILTSPEEPTQSFSDAVHMALDGTVIFETDLENEVPVEVTGYENNSALMYDVYINGALCKRLKYSVLGGNPKYSTYDTTGELYVSLTVSTGEITLYANEGDTCHIKIVKKSRPESIMVFANKSGDAILVDAAFGDILTAAKEGYTFQLAIDGEVSGSTRYSEIGTLAASFDSSTYTATFDSSVTWRGESITWTVNLLDMSISGAVGGINN